MGSRLGVGRGGSRGRGGSMGGWKALFISFTLSFSGLGGHSRHLLLDIALGLKTRNYFSQISPLAFLVL